MLLLVILFLSAAAVIIFGNHWEGQRFTILLGVKKEPISSLMIDNEQISLLIQESYQPFVILKGEDGSRINVAEHSRYSTSDQGVAEIEEYGSITAKSPGNATISIHYKDFKKEISVSVQKENRQVDVKKYGAVGDGITDDTMAFQSAIDNLSAKGGGDVVVPEGVYSLHPLFLKPNINLVGENRDTVILKLADDVPDGQHRLINMNNHTKVQNITCNGNYVNHPNGNEHMHCIFAYDKDHVVIKDNRLINAVGDGISISGSAKTSNYVTISNNIVEENQRSQIVIEQVNHLRIIGNTIRSETGRPGIHFEPWEKMQYYDANIARNTITTNTDGYAVMLTGGEPEGAGQSAYLFHGIEFYQNKINSPSGLLRIIDTSGVNVHDNILNVRYIHVWRKNENVNIINNIISGKSGILLEGSEEGSLISAGTKIMGNTFQTSEQGIFILGSAVNTAISNNIFEGSGESSGIKLFASININDLTITANTFSHYDKGVAFDYDSNKEAAIHKVEISNNHFSHIKDYALYIMGPANLIKVDRNTITNSSGAYISAHAGYPMSAIDITNNIITGGKAGIVQTAYGRALLDRLKITGNHISNVEDGTAIELDTEEYPPANVTIAENELINNAKNIGVPKQLENSVYNNSFRKN
ncbi:hypothetical protein WQ57_18385 [Mesobacillus campisalis]|uniref:Pectate lyase superfamily protein domain-containing protein n=1 Tax=Mesobacillus campisalis TaxID=1408103 RepID=A0A0M2SUF0_9BACI|nr:right-handed parallel beta-helix repeat-containing protein [Mesobacillus campisalis]KKK36617.1 hypothetical protein WQ57_18385 [Mesobacillus campisalis]